nr:hypothetical protein [Salipiger aestuarii]
MIGRIQLEVVPWENRRDRPELDSDPVLAELTDALSSPPGIAILGRTMAPASAKPVQLRLKSDGWETLLAAAVGAIKQPVTRGTPCGSTAQARACLKPTACCPRWIRSGCARPMARCRWDAAGARRATKTGPHL